eukprot:7389995-Prymnesium_polylepis.1
MRGVPACALRTCCVLAQCVPRGRGVACVACGRAARVRHPGAGPESATHQRPLQSARRLAASASRDTTV